ncbi:MAG TPA: slipin family protein [Rectinema sp.]|nr:slipin family protein [Spirochaetia bacterium]MDI9427621.1 slipin family protein [Spirochaetota bacterium]NLH90512.1 slipin family protein [Treponema sp.]HOI99775.1 slipin family protein [Rectinema sp.]HPB61583.1 slipin family protein [Rectinema sp.]
MLWIYTIFAVLSAWWVVFIIIAAIRKQKPVFLFLLILFLVWGISEIILMMSSPPIAAILFIVPFLILIQMMRVVQEYQRGVLFRFGRLQKVMEPGFNLILPFGIDSLRKVDMRTFTIDVPKQEVITRDNVPVIVDAVVYFNVFDSMLAVVKIADYTKGTSLLAQTILRSVLGQHELDEMLAQRAQLGQVLQALLDDATDPWGIRVSAVEIKAIELAETMKRAMARQAEAERERRAKIIAAEGELQASEKLAQAADVLAKSPASLQLRYLQTLSEIAVEKNSTIVFPLPMDLLNVISKVAEKSSE